MLTRFNDPRSLPAVSFRSCLILLMLASSGLLFAEDEPSALETLVVTAHRTPMPESELGSSVTLLERQLIDDRQIVLASDLLQDVPSIAVSRVGGPGAQTQLRLRGAEANHVLVLIDGIKANDPAGGDEFDFAALTAFDVADIEVIRGPQSALWGSEATAGVINITTRQADELLDASGFLEGGSRDTIFTGGRIAAGTDRGGLALNLSYYETRGESSALDGDEDDGYENLTLGLNGSWAPTDRSRLSFSARHADSEAEYDGLGLTTGLPADADLVSLNDLTLLKGEGGVVMLDDRWDHNFRVTWLDSDRAQYRDGDWESSTAAEKIGAYYQSTLSFETGGQHLILAVDYEEERFEQRGFVFGNDPNQNQKRDNTGWVVEYLAQPLEDLNLSGSLRYDDNSDFKNVTTYRFTGSYTVQTGTRLRASYGTGQKAPTFTELYGFYPESFVGNPELKPEYSRGFDVGILQAFGSGRWRADLGYFNERLEDEITTVYDFDSLLSSADNLTGESKRQGIEVEVHGRIVDNLDLALSYTFTDTNQPDGSREVRRPRHMAAANFNYGFLSGRAGMNLNFSYTGSQTDQVFLPPLYAPETVELADYLLVNLTGRYRVMKRLELYLRAENLFDEAYVNVVGYRSPGRSIHAGVRLSTGR
jgi:vitamin B12 transporter